MGSVMAEVRLPDLTILDAIWILARPGQGPSSSYVDATRRDVLLAATDPVALDVWATKHVLIPAILENGYPATSFFTTQDPDNPASRFRSYLDRSLAELLEAGVVSTNRPEQVELRTWSGDADRDGDVDWHDSPAFIDCLTGPGGEVAPACRSCDFGWDQSIDLTDFALYQRQFSAGE